MGQMQCAAPKADAIVCIAPTFALAAPMLPAKEKSGPLRARPSFVRLR